VMVPSFFEGRPKAGVSQWLSLEDAVGIEDDLAFLLVMTRGMIHP